MPMTETNTHIALLGAAIQRIELDISAIRTEQHEIKRTIAETMVGDDASPGVLIRVDRLQQTVNLMKWIVGAVVTALIGAAAAWLFSGHHP